MQNPDDFGTNADGGKNNEYCSYCFRNGKFTEPNMTVEQMIEKCAGIMKQMQMSQAQIEQTKTFIPMLKRWMVKKWNSTGVAIGTIILSDPERQKNK